MLYSSLKCQVRKFPRKAVDGRINILVILIVMLKIEKKVEMVIKRNRENVKEVVIEKIIKGKVVANVRIDHKNLILTQTGQGIKRVVKGEEIKVNQGKMGSVLNKKAELFRRLQFLLVKMTVTMTSSKL